MKKYYSGDGERAYVSIKLDKGKFKYTSYARYLMEQYLGRPLRKDEEVHHIDGDKTNDVIENLVVVNGTEHRRNHALKYPEKIEWTCFECGKKFILTKEQRRRYTQKRSNKFFCSKKCVGIYGRREQLNRNIHTECE